MNTKNPTVLDGSVRLVLVQFNFSSLDVVPVRLPNQKRQETPEEAEFRRGPSGVHGEQFIAPTENCDLSLLEIDLAGNGYHLVDGLYQKRYKDGNTYHMVRFTFAHPDHAKPSAEFKNRWENDVRNALRQICRDAMWRVRAYLNPFFAEGKPVDGAHAMQFCLEARKPYLDGKGKRIGVWPRDAAGNKLKVEGQEPPPLMPDFVLCITENGARLKRR